MLESHIWWNVGAFFHRRERESSVLRAGGPARICLCLVELRLERVKALLRVVRRYNVRTGVYDRLDLFAVQRLNHGFNSLVAHLVSHLCDRHGHLAGQDRFTSGTVAVKAEEDGVFVCFMACCCTSG